MTLDGWLTLAVVGGVLLLLAKTRLAPDLILIAALTLLLLFGVITPNLALSGFASVGLATVAVLYLVASGVMETGALRAASERLLGTPRSERWALLRLMPPVSAASALLNNTPIVAMLVPTVQQWARRHQIAPSRLLLPLSYAAIFGGSCTLIGTSTNLIVADLAAAQGNTPTIGFFEIAWLGLPSLLLGTLFVILTAPWLLPLRHSSLSTPTRTKEYAIEMLISSDSDLVGRTIEQAGLRRLHGLYLAEIERGGNLLPAVSPHEPLYPHDRLLFVGDVTAVIDLYKIRGLHPAPEQLFKLSGPRHDRILAEAVVSPASPFLGQTLREARFRTHYQAVVIAVARGGERLPGKVGDLVTCVGDTLLLEARPAFLERYRHSRDFLLISPLEESAPPRHERANLALALLLGMILAVVLLGVSMLLAALVTAALMLATRCTSPQRARNNIDWQVLLTIGAAIGLGQAMEQSGAAAAIAHAWIALAGENPWLTLLAIYLLTSFFTETITNNAAAVLMFSIAKAAAEGLGVSFTPFIFVIMMAASASFATPIGYQTNLMVYGPGGYHFSDYLRIGIPLNLLMAAISVTLAPLIWPF